MSRESICRWCRAGRRQKEGHPARQLHCVGLSSARLRRRRHHPSTIAPSASRDRLCLPCGRFSSRHCAGPRQTRLDERRPDHRRRPEPNPRPEPEQELRPEHRAGAEQRPQPAVTAAPPPSQRGSTTPYQGWFRPETTTSVWLASNSIDDLAQAQRQEAGGGASGVAAGAVTLTAGLLAALAAR